MNHKWPAICRQNGIGLTNYLKSIILFLFSFKINLVWSKGGAVRGGSSGAGAGGAGGVCLDCGNYTEEEMQIALIILVVILCVFFALCSCQCYNRMKYECNEDSLYNKQNTVPVAPYYKSNRTTNQANNLTAALMDQEIILPFSSSYNNV